jgi:hypothetical protein
MKCLSFRVARTYSEPEAHGRQATLIVASALMLIVLALCVSLRRPALVHVLRWLDLRARPAIAIGTASSLRRRP